MVFIVFYYTFLYGYKTISIKYIVRINGMNEKIYVLDDDSALKVTNDKIELISEGKWFEIN